MDTVLIIDIQKKETSQFSIKDKLNISCNKEYKQFEYSIKEVGGKGIEQRAHDFILDHLNKTKYKACIINSDSVTNYFGEKFITHLRLTQNCKNQNIPVLIISDQDLKSIISRKPIANRGIPSIFSCNNIFHLLEVDMEIINDDYFANLTPKSNEDIKKNFLSKINILPLAGSHSVANIWGAYRISSLLKLYSPIEKSHSLYIKYLLAKYPIKEKESESTTLNNLHKKAAGKKVLYIDDESDLWVNNLKHLLGEKCELDIIGINDIKAKEDNKEGFFELIKEKLLTKNYNVVILDLRLFRSDNNIESRDDVKQFTSVKILDHIKKDYADISVLIFTASNKAWNHHYIKEAGAIASFIKESPDFGIDIDYSKQNLDNLVSSLDKCFERNDLLKEFWFSIKRLQKNKFTFEENNAKVIVDRLKTFFALINWQWFRSKYDKRFSPYRSELAFITLWSVLNQLVQDNFEEIVEQGQKTNNKKLIHIKLKNSDKFYLKQIKRGSVNNYSFIVDTINFFIDSNKNGSIKSIAFDKQNKNFYRPGEEFILIKKKTRPFAPKTTLKAYVQFLIFHKLNGSRKLKIQELENLEKINKFRNNIPWTHGIEEVSNNNAIGQLKSYSQKQREQLIGMIALLFNLIMNIISGEIKQTLFIKKKINRSISKPKKVNKQGMSRNTLGDILSSEAIEKLKKGLS